MKKMFVAVLAGLLLLPLTTYADCGGKSCSSKKEACGKKDSCGKKEESCCPIVGKIMHCSSFLLANAKEIGLSDDQIKVIQQIKNDTIKQGIQAKAGMEVFMIDMQSKLSEEKLDVEGITKMIDDGTKAMSEGGKASLQSLVKLHETVKPDQLKKAKELCKQSCGK